MQGHSPVCFDFGRVIYLGEQYPLLKAEINGMWVGLPHKVGFDLGALFSRSLSRILGSRDHAGSESGRFRISGIP